MRFEFNDDSQKICNSADVVNYGIQCDICGNKVLSVSNINGKRYCAGCYYKTFMKDNQKAEIDQLKQQLKEKDKEIKSLIVDYEKRISQEQELMSNMEHRLTEKQNTIDEINKEFVQAVHDWKVLCAEKDKEIAHLEDFIGCKGCLDVIKKSNDNQTQLAIQELEKVKVNLKDRITMMSNEEHSYLQKVVIRYDICNQVNKQIKELKGEKDVKD